MKKILFISANELNGIKNGGQNGSYKNLKLLQLFFNVDVINFSRKNPKKVVRTKENYYQMAPTKNKLEGLIANIFNYAGYLNRRNETEILEIIKKNKYEIIFLDSSNYGRLIEKIKKIKTNIIIMTFFHNIEYFYIEGIKKDKKNIIKLLWNIKLKSTYYNEKKAIRYSDYLFLLNKRDKNQFEKKYGKNTKINFLPVSFEDKNIKFNNKIGSYILFVGAYFYANYNGIKWFVENVMSVLENKKLLIVGKGFENCKKELEKNNVEVIGTVEDIESYYINASCVIAPIFEGAGMKVKTAEALMYGKTIYGTTEAFEGYEINYDKVGGLCNNKEEFIEKLNKEEGNTFNKYSREIFLEKYSFKSSKESFETFLIKNNIF